MDKGNGPGQPSRLLIRGNRGAAEIAFTYDAGSADCETSDILAVLAGHGVKCTFFLTGVWVEKFPELALRIVREGHEIGNHSYGHPDMAKITYQEMLETVLRGEQAIEKATGVDPKPLFRQPFGSFNKEILRAVGEAGYPYSVYWDVDPIDWERPAAQTIVDRILAKAGNGSIVLLHLDGSQTARATGRSIGTLKARGFTFVTIGEMIRRL